jgi:hypothetical protein
MLVVVAVGGVFLAGVGGVGTVGELSVVVVSCWWECWCGC